MSRLLVIFIVLFLAWAFWTKLNKLPKEQKRPYLIKALLWGILGFTFVLVATGRVHWIAAAVAASLPVLKAIFSLLIRSLPLLQVWLKKAQASQQTTEATATDITEEEAYQLLGLEKNASREAIIQAHKRLIQKLHPDRGGNDYLAAKLNAAKDLLLKKQTAP